MVCKNLIKRRGVTLGVVWQALIHSITLSLRMYHGTFPRSTTNHVHPDLMALPDYLLLQLQFSDSGRSEWAWAEPSATVAPTHAASTGRPLESWPLILMESNVKGRHVVAARDLAAGELVWEESPFVQVVDDRVAQSVCHHCFELLASTSHMPRTCNACRQVVYCSTGACAELGLTTHAAECGVLQAIASQGGAAAHSGARGLRLFVRLLDRAAAEPEAFVSGVESMEEHYTHAAPERRRFLDAMSTQVNRMVAPVVRMDEIRLARCISRVHTNLFAVTDCAGIQYGSALYAKAGSLFNHCCWPTAVASFVSTTLRVHTLAAVPSGSEVSISYTELYAGRDERRAVLQAKKGFQCRCVRCTVAPASDAELDGWCCGKSACDGAISVAQTSCARCGTAHALAPQARAAFEKRWRETIEQATLALNTTGQMAAAVERAIGVAERVLSQSGGRLRERHALRHRARLLTVLARRSLPNASGLVKALEACIADISCHLPPAHPELAIQRYFLAKALWRQAGEVAPGSRMCIRLRKQARAAADTAIDELSIAYGKDHPTVVRWQAADVAHGT